MLKNVLGFFFRAIFRFLAMSCFYRATPITIYIWFFIIMLFYFIGRLILMLFMKEWQKTTRQKKTRKVNLFRCGSEIAEAIYVLGRLSLLFSCVCCSTEAGIPVAVPQLQNVTFLMFSSHANFRECVFFCTRRTLSIEITFLLFWLARHKRFSTVFSLSNSHTNCELKRLHYNNFFCFQLYFLCFSSDCEGNLVFFFYSAL